MPVTSVYRIGGGSSITTDNSESLAAQSAANGALSSTLSSAGVTLTGAGLGVSTGLNVTGSATVSGLTATGFVSLSGAGQASNVSLSSASTFVTNNRITANSIVITTPTTISMPNLFVTLSGGYGFTISGAVATNNVNYFIAKY